MQEVIQVFGWKVFPFKIENVIKTMNNVSSAIVISLKDKGVEACLFLSQLFTKCAHISDW